MADQNPFTNESFTKDDTTINPNDNLTTPGKINFSTTFTAGNGTPSKQDLELTLHADLFRPAITLTINPISKSIPVNQPINVTFTCSDPSVNFLVNFVDLENNQRSLITPPQKGSSGFQFTPKIITSKCVIEMYARDTSLRVLAIARSNEFGITPPLPSQPPNVSLSIEQVNDFSAGEYKKIKFNYTGPQPHHFVLVFYDSQNKTNISGQLVSSSTDFDFTAPVIASNNCMFVITAIAADGSQIIQSPSNSFQILPGVSVIIEPIYNAVPINSNLVVKFKYTGPKPSDFQVGITNQGKKGTPLVSVNASPNSNNDYTVTIKVPNNKNIVSNDCYVLVNVLVANKITNFYYSNQFKIVDTPVLPKLSINPISDLSLNTTNKILFTFNSNAHYFRAFFSSNNGSNYNQLPLINGNNREFDFKAEPISSVCLIKLIAFDSSNNEIDKTISNQFAILKKYTNSRDPYRRILSSLPERFVSSVGPGNIQLFVEQALSLDLTEQQIYGYFNLILRGNNSQMLEQMNRYLIDKGTNQKLITTLNQKQITAKDYETSMVQINIGNKVIQIGSRDTKILINNNQEIKISIKNLGKKGYIQYGALVSPNLIILHNRLFGNKFDVKKFGSVQGNSSEDIVIKLKPMNEELYNQIKSQPLSLDIITKVSGIKINTEQLDRFKKDSITTKITFIPQ